MNLKVESKSPTWLLALLTVVLIVCATSVYLPRTATTVQESDGGELATAIPINALIHPPGYPLYSLLGRVYLKFSASNPYAALATFSAICQALAVGLLFLGSWIWSRKLGISFGLSFAWLLFEPTMRSAVDVEVFALHHLLVTTLLLLLGLLRATNHTKLLGFLSGLIFGLAGAHHQTVVFWLPFTLAVLISGSVRSNSFDPKLLLLFGVGASLGLTPYLMLLRLPETLVFPRLESLSDLLRHMLRLDYGTFQIHSGAGSNQSCYLWHFLRLCATTAPLLLLGFALPFCVLLRRPTLLLLGLVLSIILHVWFGTKLIFAADQVLHGEWVMRFYGILSLAGVYGSACVLSAWQIPKLYTHSIVALLLTCAAIGAPRGLAASDNRADRTVDYELEQILTELPKHAIFFPTLDRVAMGLLYKQKIEGKRRDIYVIPAGLFRNTKNLALLKTSLQLPIEIAPMAPLSFQSFVERVDNLGFRLFAYAESALPAGFGRWPVGLTWQWMPADFRPTTQQLTESYLAFCSRWPDDLGLISKYRKHSHRIIKLLFFAPMSAHIRELSDQADKELFVAILRAASQGKIIQAKALCQKALQSMGGSSAPKAYN